MFADPYERELLAVPLTADQAQDLIAVLQDVVQDVVQDARRPGIPEQTRRTAARIANRITERAGAALAGNHGYVPQPVSELDEYAKIADMLRTWAGPRQLDQLTAMLTVMHALRGMGAVHNWRVVNRRGVLVWVEEPVIVRRESGARWSEVIES